MGDAAKRARVVGTTTLSPRAVCGSRSGDMIRPSSDLKVYLCREPMDMRKQIDGMALLVQEATTLNPFDQALLVFSNRQRDNPLCQPSCPVGDIALT